MAIQVGTNSYVTIVEADTYLTDRLEAEEWFNLVDTGTPGQASKTTYLISAYNWLQSAPALSLPSSSNDDNLKQAQIEAAFYLLEHYTALNARRAIQAQGVESARLSKKWETYVDPTKSEIPAYITGGISQYDTANDVVDFRGQYDD